MKKVASWSPFLIRAKMKLELFYYDQCPFCQYVVQKINQLSLREKITFSNTLTEPENHKRHKEKTGRTTVPCLYVDDQPMFESSDIMNWLDDNLSKI
jgi:glutaredoxin